MLRVFRLGAGGRPSRNPSDSNDLVPPLRRGGKTAFSRLGGMRDTATGSRGILTRFPVASWGIIAQGGGIVKGKTVKCISYGGFIDLLE